MNTTDILTSSPLELESSLGISTSAVLKLIKKTAESVAQPIYGECVKQINSSKLSSGDRLIDEFLDGGILSNGITEICGESASGKTQLCLQLSIMAQLSKENGGLDSEVIYVSTEDAFPDKRLRQMVSSQRFPIQPGHNIFDHIFIEHTADISSLLVCLEHRIPILLKQRSVNLVIIDSIAGAVRGDDSILDSKNHQKQISLAVSQLSARLHSLVDRFPIHLVCVNQVSDVFQDNADLMSSLCVAEQKQTSALGLFWANQVCTRIMLNRTERTVPMTVANSNTNISKSTEVLATVRKMTLLFAPHLPLNWIYFIIDINGVHGWVF